MIPKHLARLAQEEPDVAVTMLHEAGHVVGSWGADVWLAKVVLVPMMVDGLLLKARTESYLFEHTIPLDQVIRSLSFGGAAENQFAGVLFPGRPVLSAFSVQDDLRYIKRIVENRGLKGDPMGYWGSGLKVFIERCGNPEFVACLFDVADTLAKAYMDDQVYVTGAKLRRILKKHLGPDPVPGPNPRLPRGSRTIRS